MGQSQGSELRSRRGQWGGAALSVTPVSSTSRPHGGSRGSVMIRMIDRSVFISTSRHLDVNFLSWTWMSSRSQTSTAESQKKKKKVVGRVGGASCGGDGSAIKQTASCDHLIINNKVFLLLFVHHGPGPTCPTCPTCPPGEGRGRLSLSRQVKELLRGYRWSRVSD